MAVPIGDLDWDDLRYFLAVSRQGTIRGGAQSIGSNHATVARRISVLEASVDARLFDRTQTGLKLTQLGEDLVPFAKSIEEQVAAASRAVAGRDLRPSGTVRLSIAPFLATSSIVDDIADFCKQYEDIEVNLHVTDRFVDFDRREADVSIRYAYEVLQDVVGRRLVQCANAAYCSPEYANNIQDDGGKNLSWIGWTEETEAKGAKWIDNSHYPNAVLRHRVPEGHLQMSMAAAGVGLAILPTFVADRHSGLVRAPYQQPVLDRSLWLLLHADLRKTARIRLFVDFLAERVLARKAEFAG